MISRDEIEKRITLFKADIVENDTSDMIGKYYKHILSPVVMSDGLYYALIRKVAVQFGVDITDVFMVGSGRLGFTIKPECEYRHFNNESDIDLAIVSEELFEKIWMSVEAYKSEDKSWNSSSFCKYLLKGWIRPDLLPPSKKCSFANEWWEYFRTLTSSGEFGPYKITAGLYYSHHFFDKYQASCINLCRSKLMEVDNENNSNE